MIRNSDGYKRNKLGLSLRNEDFYKDTYINLKYFESTVKTGDLLLFRSYECLPNCQRFFTRDQYDHVCLIIKKGQEIELFESNSGDNCNILKWDKFKRNLYNLAFKKVVLRRLNMEEEDPIKFFSQQQRKKEKEEEAKKYLLPISEEEDPLKFFDKKDNEEKEADPLKFLNKDKEGENEEFLENLDLYNEEKMAKKIKSGDIPDIIVLKKKEESPQVKEKRLEKKLKTALRLSQRTMFVKRFNEKLLDRVKNTKNVAIAEDAIKKPDEVKKTGNMLLGEEEQIDPNKNAEVVKQTKEVDLKSFMENKPKKDDGGQ